MKKRTAPQISPGLFKKLLDFDKIEKGTRIYLELDQTKVHWQHKSYIITGIDNGKQVLLVKDANEKPHAIPFDLLGAYWVLVNHVTSKYSYSKKYKTRKRQP